jgi:hypothetical protein
MSNNTTAFNNGQQLQVNTNLAKLFPYEKEFKQYNLTNSGYDPVTYPAGTVMGVISATGQVIPLKSGAADGSQFPVGVLAQDYTIEDGATASVAICVSGWVRADMLVFDGSDTVATIVSGRRLFERIGGDTVGILLITPSNCTTFDNQLT